MGQPPEPEPMTEPLATVDRYTYAALLTVCVPTTTSVQVTSHQSATAYCPA